MRPSFSLSGLLAIGDLPGEQALMYDLLTINLNRFYGSAREQFHALRVAAPRLELLRSRLQKHVLEEKSHESHGYPARSVRRTRPPR